jgi:glycosyltransferase involved in cell wall biosynthesis
LQAAGHLPDQGVTHAFDVLARAVVAAAGLRQTIATLQDVSPVCGSINRLWQNGQLCPGCSPERLIKHCLTTHEHRGLGRWARIVRYHTALPHRTQLLDHFTHLTTVSNFLKNFLELDRATVIPDLLIPPRPACRLERTTAPRIVAVGRLAFDKGTDLILRALADLPEFLAAFVGAGDLERWRSLAQALGVTDRTTFAGPVPAHEVGAWYHQADVVVLASRAPEASSRTILEGMSLGKPVVAPNCAGPAELVTEGSTGRLFPRGDATGLAHAIRRAHSERLTLGARARLASERYHPKRIGPRYCALYESLVS